MVNMNIEKQIREYLTEEVLFSDDSIEYSNDDSLLEAGVVDSVAVMEMILFVEETFNVEVADQEIIPDNFDSVNRLANFIRSKIGSSDN